jgi:hypothetical protein
MQQYTTRTWNTCTRAMWARCQHVSWQPVTTTVHVQDWQCIQDIGHDRQICEMVAVRDWIQFSTHVRSFIHSFIHSLLLWSVSCSLVTPSSWMSMCQREEVWGAQRQTGQEEEGGQMIPRAGQTQTVVEPRPSSHEQVNLLDEISGLTQQLSVFHFIQLIILRFNIY